MKKTLFSICALMLSLTASAQVFDTPAGTLIEGMYRSSDSWVKKGWTGTEPGRYEGLVSKIVVGKDDCLYVYNPLSGLNSKSWLKLKKMSDGKYRAELPQAIHKDNNGGDDDDESASTERTLMLNRIKKIDGEYKVVAKKINYVDFSWDGSTLQMLGLGKKSEFVAMTYNDKWETLYGDWNVTISPIDNSLITPPAGAVKKQYSMTSKDNGSPRIIEAAVTDNEIYLKGVFKSRKLANVWIKLLKQDGKAVLLTNQYLGTTVKTDFKSYSNDMAEYHTYAAAFNDAATVADKLEFSIAADGKMTCDKILKIVQGRSSATNIPKEDLESYEGIELRPHSDKVGNPETPKLHYCSASQNYDYTKTTTTLAFYVKNVDVEGNYLNPEKMYYNVYVNDNKEPFTFKKSADYYYLDNDLTNIPFNFKDKMNFDIKIADDQRLLHFYEEGIKKLTVIMVYEENGKKLSSNPLTTEVVTAGIENLNVNKNAAEKYYTVDGRQLQQLQKGLNIVKSSDGKTRKVIVK